MPQAVCVFTEPLLKANNLLTRLAEDMRDRQRKSGEPARFYQSGRFRFSVVYATGGTQEFNILAGVGSLNHLVVAELADWLVKSDDYASFLVSVALQKVLRDEQL